jgi:hypothetical protein
VDAKRHHYRMSGFVEPGLRTDYNARLLTFLIVHNSFSAVAEFDFIWTHVKHSAAQAASVSRCRCLLGNGGRRKHQRQ